MKITALILLPLLGSSTFGELTKEPESDSVMISNGFKLKCRSDSGRIAWTAENSAGGTETELTGSAETEVDDDEDGIFESELILKEEKFTPGVIKCRSGVETRRWNLMPFFKLEHLPKSKAVVEGDNVEIPCKLIDKSYSGSDSDSVQFKWFKFPHETDFEEGQQSVDFNLGTELFPENRINIKYKGNDTSVLSLASAEFEDRAVYLCSANKTDSSVLGSTTHTLIRVKDKYAALYPFLGIVLEVAALCLIIFFCERRKSALARNAEEDEEEEFQNAANNGAGGGSNANLRNRKV